MRKKIETITGVYAITNNINDRMYIGSSNNITTRFYLHKLQLNKNKHCNTFLQRSWNKYGEENFTFKLLEECTIDKQIETEQKYIDIYKVTHKLYNMAPVAGTVLGIKRSEATKQLMSEVRKGIPPNRIDYKHSEETKEKIREANTGYRHAESSNEKNRQAHLGTTQTKYAKQRIAEFQRTQTRSKETRRRISEAKKGIPKSEETKEKLRQANLGKKQSDANKEALRQANIGNKYNLGRVQTPEEKLRRSESMKRFRSQQRLEREQSAQAI
jgi:group I intron endonuclease